MEYNDIMMIIIIMLPMLLSTIVIACIILPSKLSINDDDDNHNVNPTLPQSDTTAEHFRHFEQFRHLYCSFLS